MPWREWVAAHIGPGGLAGLRLGDWFKLLADNRFAVDPPYWLRAGAITWGALQNSLFGCYERLRYEAAIRATKPLPPLFVLGMWRSGTTHLHNLLAQDHRFAFPSTYEAMYPHTFLTTQWFNEPFLARVIPDRRPQDNMRLRVEDPQEDEFALNCLTQQSFLLSLAFPRRMAHYARFLSLRDCTRDELERWQSALRWFVQKLTLKHRRPLILKSPMHTARIRILLEVFPEARFVHIHRNPYDVFLSARHLAQKIAPWWTLQHPDYRNLEEHVLQQYEEVYAAYFAERHLIPAGRLHEIRYEALEADPLGELLKLYSALGLGDFTEAESAVRSYLDSIAGYQKNLYCEVESPWKEQITHRWRRSFDEWGYAI